MESAFFNFLSMKRPLYGAALAASQREKKPKLPSRSDICIDARELLRALGKDRSTFFGLLDAEFLPSIADILGPHPYLKGEFHRMPAWTEARCQRCLGKASVSEIVGGAFAKYPRTFCDRCHAERMASRAPALPEERINAKAYFIGEASERTSKYERTVDEPGVYRLEHSAQCWECGKDFWSSRYRRLPRTRLKQLSERAFCPECTERFGLSSTACAVCKTKCDLEEESRSLVMLQVPNLRVCAPCLTRAFLRDLETRPKAGAT